MNIRKQNVNTEESTSEGTKPFRGCGCTYIPTILGDTCKSLIGDPGSDAQCIGDWLSCNTGNYCGNLNNGEQGETRIPPGAVCQPIPYRDGETSMPDIETVVGPEVIETETETD